MEASSTLKTSGLQDQSQHATTGAVARLQSAKAWMRDVYVSTTENFLPAVKETYRENKTWCDRIGIVAACIGVYSGVLSLPVLGFGGLMYAAGSASDSDRGSMNKEISPGTAVKSPSPVEQRDFGNNTNLEACLTALMEVFGDVQMIREKFSDDVVDPMAMERALAVGKRIYSDICNTKGSTLQGQSDEKVVDEFIKEFTKVVFTGRRHTDLVLLHELYRLILAGENIDDIPKAILGESFQKTCAGVSRKHRPDYEQLAVSFLRSCQGGVQGVGGLHVSDNFKYELLHALTASLFIADGKSEHEVMHKVDKFYSEVYRAWKNGRRGSLENSKS
ncbi:hypothetical protein [Endozoicomonas atrinae]|uniref:hypothetical protein n=1 Tax=Endozoicomonas atrinae TaxID=1333660 RepID=UPI000825D3EA|nr:hypothetical protein [Endozoicomonas atrinae]